MSITLTRGHSDTEYNMTVQLHVFLMENLQSITTTHLRITGIGQTPNQNGRQSK